MKGDCLNAYYAVFDFLDSVWEEKGRNDDLGMLLSTMNPHLWSNKMSIDKKIMDDWVMIYDKYFPNDSVDLYGCFDVAINFLSLQQKLLVLGINDIIEYLKETLQSPKHHSKTWSTWIDCYTKFMKQ
jgi:hypothetical protein